ncbi:alpha-amylase [Rudanella paleaurantiibacter]|uniref:Alpha-amylase n=2 Tax=Rudanella paleaurantiibacter TaxID=2614655 RepID=A0A7J5TZW3_9BACT|nr:alpha-amylase [Rudanella paleaurantiibacter]
MQGTGREHNLMQYNLLKQTSPLAHTGVHYEIFVRAFCDSNGDGIGDLNGVTAKLDYLQDLGISAIWLMPINPSPSYHKYDVTDYYGIDPEYGTLDDFRRLVQEAHRRGIAVLMDLVLHHTSSKHPWFTEACKGPDNPYWSYYKWLHPDEIKARNLATRDITADSSERNPWHRVAGASYPERYYGMFWNQMPDLNFDHPAVRQEFFQIARFWLAEIGVDGFRLDAARHLYREFEEPKNHQFWEEFRREVETVLRTGDHPGLRREGVHLVGEVWTRPAHVAPYFRGLHANFNFDFALSLAEVIRQEDDTEDLIELLAFIQGAYEQVEPNFIDALILSNHDQDRIGSVLKGHTDRLKVAANLLLTLPGNPYLYYGEEIGMLGQKPDEHIREPFVWNVGKHDPDRARWNKTGSRSARYSTSRTVRPLATQQTDPDSLFSHYKRLIGFRNSHPVLNDNLSRIELSGIRQTGLVAFIRRSQTGERSLLVHNLTGQPISTVLPPEEAAFTQLNWHSSPATHISDASLTVGPYSVALLDPNR